MRRNVNKGGQGAADMRIFQDRLREHAKAFDGLLSLIPAKMYYGEDHSVRASLTTQPHSLFLSSIYPLCQGIPCYGLQKASNAYL